MITNIFFNIVEMMIGFAGGLAVGSGFIAFLSVLGIIPRLTQLSKARNLLTVYGVSGNDTRTYTIDILAGTVIEN